LNSFVRAMPSPATRWRRPFSTRIPSFAERIGFSGRDRILIVNCDDLGCSESTNTAIERSLRQGLASSATLMVPCAWAPVAAKACRDLDIGVHLTLTSEFTAYRWSPLTGAKSLRDKDGYFPRTIEEVWAHADLADVELECRAQIDQALAWGIDVTHIDSHMDTLQLDRHFFDVYMRLAEDYRLPMRLRHSSFEWPFSHMSHATLASREISTTDRFLAPEWGDPGRTMLEACGRKLAAGVTEIALHPADDSEELRAYDTEYADMRIADADCLMDSALRHTLHTAGVKFIGYRPLRDALRNRLRRDETS
jgi:predicted glycoside hydrolase/deacetylase ChbG (UPF0249 family)